MAAYAHPSECKVALLCGGTSGERAVSLESGKGAQAALLEAGFQVTMLDPSVKKDLVTLVKEHFDVAFMAKAARMEPFKECWKCWEFPISDRVLQQAPLQSTK